MKKENNIVTPHIITLSGPSLSGKTELSKILQNDYNYNTVVSVTTRPRRAQEVDGVDYHFLTEEEYYYLNKNNNLIQKTNYNNYNYGVSEEEVLSKKDKPILWVIAPKSIDQVERICQEKGYLLTKIFVNNPDDVLMGRLFKRFRDDILADVKTYVKRLEDMINIEKNWINEANYDHIINEFNQNNTQQIVSEVIDIIDNRSLNKKKLKF